MKFKDYYKILELDNSKVSIEQIKSAYRKQAKKYHPDVNVGNKLAEERIKDINEAYRTLSNTTLKRKYDRTWNYNVRSKERKARQKTSGDFLNMFFGNNELKEELEQSKIPSVRGEDIETEINIKIEEGFYGSDKKIALKDVDGKTKTITMKIPEGIQNGEKIRLIGQGKEGKNGGKNGDLYIKINIENSKKYTLEGNDIYTIIPITPWEAALGAKAKVRSIDDTKSQIFIPNGIQSGEKIEIPQKGYKNAKGERGKLVAQVQIVVPEKLTKEEKDMFKKLKEISKFNPRRV